MYTLRYRDYIDDHRIVNILPRFPQEPFPEHAHDFHELVLVKSGSGIHVCNGHATHVNRGSMMYLREEDVHLFDGLDGLCLTNVLFLPCAFQASRQITTLLAEGCHPGRDPIALSPLAQEKAEVLLTQISEENLKQEDYSSLMIEALFSLLAVTLWRSRKAGTGHRSEEAQGFMSLLGFINENYQNELKWPDLADRFHIPMRTLNRRLREQTGLSPNGYLVRIRLCRAACLLSHTKDAVTAIAFSCGFGDSNYFSARFRQAFKMTPKQYRRRFGNP